MRLSAERDRNRDLELHQHPSKSKRLLKALLSRRKSKKDDLLIHELLDLREFENYKMRNSFIDAIKCAQV
ncbi:unnamed protein product [Sphenostylis stenocarpa]|uniref:Uncharacterized protein n=1 Tax=Sphenostylis stenocarpa TaxID=92480 RepID=A0AA86TEB7_9FABA|nr:unnamed protein product [Sphenostylis stenocarpa]